VKWKKKGKEDFFVVVCRDRPIISHTRNKTPDHFAQQNPAEKKKLGL